MSGANVHLEHLGHHIYLARFYKAGSFNEKSKYCATCAVVKRGKTAYVYGLCGEFNKKLRNEFVLSLLSLGATEYKAERRGELVCVQIGERNDTEQR
jgi:hypothetical protein